MLTFQKPLRIAITGTKGKTTILSLLENAILQLSPESKVLSASSTEGIYLNKKFIRDPDKNYLSPVDKDNNYLEYDYFISEATSFLLYTGHYNNHIPSIAVYTGIEETEHLDVHYNFNNYLNAKKILFDLLDESSIAIVNSDDFYYKYIIKNCKANIIIKYGVQEEANYTITIKELNEKK